MCFAHDQDDDPNSEPLWVLLIPWLKREKFASIISQDTTLVQTAVFFATFRFYLRVCGRMYTSNIDHVKD